MSVGTKFLMRPGRTRFGKRVSTEDGYSFYAYLTGIRQIEALVADGGFVGGPKREFGAAGVEGTRA